MCLTKGFQRNNSLFHWSFVFFILYFIILEKAMAPHSSTLAWKIPWMDEPGGLQSVGSLRVRLNWATSLWLFTFMHQGNGNPLQCSCLKNPRDGGAWWAAIYGVAQSRTRLKWLSSRSSSSAIKKWFICDLPKLLKNDSFVTSLSYSKQCVSTSLCLVRWGLGSTEAHEEERRAFVSVSKDSAYRPMF